MYAVEVYDRNGGFVADLSGLAHSRKFEAERNAAGSISFEIDAKLLRDFASSLSTTSANLLMPGANEVRIRRHDTYLMGGQISYLEAHGDATDKTVIVHCEGFLNLFKSRFYEKQKLHTGIEASTILWTAIDESQTASANFYDSTLAPLPSADDCDLGVTQGILDTIGNKDRTYEIGKNVKDILVQMTELQTTATDIYFSPDKVLNVVERQGSDKPEIVFELGKNLISYRLPLDAQQVANRIISTGSGTEGGGTLVTSVVQDASSQANYRVRQYLRQFNSISDTDILDDHGNAYLQALKDPMDLPELDADLNGEVSIEDFWIGDRVSIKIADDELPNQPSGLYKVEKISLDISDEDLETATLVLSV